MTLHVFMKENEKNIEPLCFRDFSWSPSDNYLAYWVPEQNNIPARVTIISMPSRVESCVRNLFNVADCRMHWQKNGDFLCVKVDRYSKARKAEDTGQWKYSVSYRQHVTITIAIKFYRSFFTQSKCLRLSLFRPHLYGSFVLQTWSYLI